MSEAGVLDAVALRREWPEIICARITPAPARTEPESWNGPASRFRARHLDPRAPFHPTVWTAPLRLPGWREVPPARTISPSRPITRRVSSLWNPSSKSLRTNSAFSYTGFGTWRGSVRKPSGRVHFNLIAGMNKAGTKRDGRNVSFPGGAQAEHETQSARRHAGLIGMRDHGRIEQRRRFQRVFGQEIGAGQQPSLFGDFLVQTTASRAVAQSVPEMSCGSADAAARIRRRLHPPAGRPALPEAT